MKRGQENRPRGLLMAYKENRPRGLLIDNPIAVSVVAILAMLLGVIFCVSQAANKPISREEAIFYCGYFDCYDATWENYREIHFADGAVYDVYAHTETEEFRQRMEALEKGTKLYLLINPNNDYVSEIRTETEELLNFETSQKEIAAYGNGYVIIGMIAFAGGVFLLWYAIGSACYKRKEEARHQKTGNRTAALRMADTAVKSRTLLEATVQEYHICYRRVKSTNELVINGKVYDENKGVIEFAHKLCATVDGHRIEAGYDTQSNSYILFDGVLIGKKKRWI